MSALHVQQVSPFDCTSSAVPSLPDSLEDSGGLEDASKIVPYPQQPRLEYLPADGVVGQAAR